MKFLICTNWSYFSKACFSLTWYIDFPAWADLDWTFWAPDSNSVGIFSCQKLCMVDLDLRLRWVILGCHCWPHFLRWCFLPTQLRPWEKIAIYYIKNPFSQSQKNGQHDLRICPLSIHKYNFIIYIYLEIRLTKTLPTSSILSLSPSPRAWMAALVSESRSGLSNPATPIRNPSKPSVLPLTVITGARA